MALWSPRAPGVGMWRRPRRPVPHSSPRFAFDGMPIIGSASPIARVLEDPVAVLPAAARKERSPAFSCQPMAPLRRRFRSSSSRQGHPVPTPRQRLPAESVRLADPAHGLFAGAESAGGDLVRAQLTVSVAYGTMVPARVPVLLPFHPLGKR